MDPKSLGLKIKHPMDAQKLKGTKVKNKRPAPKQITAEQIVREAQTLQTETEYKPPKQIITDIQELEEYQLTKRKGFEDMVRRMRWNPKIWLKYSHWEESQKEFRRARSIYERLIDVDYSNSQVWLNYAEMEMRNTFVNHARNVWERAINLLPRVDQLWYKYAHMEEILNNISGARKVLERWMTWMPNHQGWQTFINFELRHGRQDHARKIYEKYIHHHSTPSSWIKYAKFEIKQGEEIKARSVYERAVDELRSCNGCLELYQEFAQFEIKNKEYSRARHIYTYALEHVPREQYQSLFDHYLTFEKQYGNRRGIEDALINKKRSEYENKMHCNPISYDVCLDYIRLEESVGEADKIREVYERAIAVIPPANSRHFWQRYIYLWINYALFEEIEMNNIDRAREVYRTILRLIPHKNFTFAKIWILAAQLEIRKKNLQGARSLFGQALGLCPKDKLFKKYLEMEFYLGNVKACRKICEKFIEFNPSNCEAWIKYAEMESTMEEIDRARGIFELAVDQPILNMPELLWKSYIDFEIQQKNRKKARALYERLVEKCKHVKVWLGYATFESTPLQITNQDELPETRKLMARSVYDRAYQFMREETSKYKKEIVMILEAWWEFERRQASSIYPESEEKYNHQLEELSKKMPRKIKRKKTLYSADGDEVGHEEYWDFIFPEEEMIAPGLKLLEAAYKWKKSRAITK